MKTKAVAREVIYTGRVQGVGFRFNARQIAQRFSVTGFVRNLADGRVQLIAAGEAGEVERFLAAVAASMERNIEQALVADARGEEVFASFEIRE